MINDGQAAVIIICQRIYTDHPNREKCVLCHLHVGSSSLPKFVP
jgi:hypothetical protein